MSSAGDISRSLKEALFETLNGILSPDHNTRLSCEEKLKVLEVTDDFGIHLAELTLDPSGVLPIRQLASVLLKQYVEAHWSQYSDKYTPPEVSEQAKTVIRQMLPLGLRESISKVRTSVAYAISGIAHWDWPDEWPGLFDLLMSCLTSGDEHAVHGAMRVMTEFSRDLSDTQIPHVAPLMLPEMYRIFLEQEKYSVRTRGRAVEIFCTAANMICTMSAYNKGITKTLLGPILPLFTDALVQGLSVPDGMTSDTGLKMEIIKTLTVLIKNLPKSMAQWLPQILPSVWSTLTARAEIYVKSVVYDQEEVDQAIDSDGKVLGFESLLFSIFDFVDVLMQSSKFSKTVKQGKSDLMYYLILYMQITEQQIEQWTLNPDVFVNEEDNDSMAYSVRISAQDLLLSLCQEFEDEGCSALCQTITRHLQEVEADSSNNCWWKIHEACMLALGAVKDQIIELLQTNNIQFDLALFLRNIVTRDLNQNVSPFLLGRCLWVGSRFPQAMDQEMLTHFLQAVVSGLNPVQPACVRIQAVRAVWGFADHLKSTNATELIVPLLPLITDALFNMTFQVSSEVLSYVLESIAIVLPINPDFTASCESKITSMAIAIFLKYNSDPLLMSLVQDIFRILCENSTCLEPLEQKLIPYLSSMLNAPPEKISTGLQAVTLEVLATVVRSCKPPLSDLLITSAFPASALCILRSDDNCTLQNGGECIRAYISTTPAQIHSFRDSQGRTGAWYAIQVASYLLNPSVSEFTATFVGKLVTSLITNLGDHLQENLDMLLRAVLSKMQGAETLTVIQSLVMVFAHLVHSQMDATLNFLSTVPGPTGESALHFVMTEWCTRQHLFFGSYDKKVSASALGKLLQHGIASEDKRLKDVEVKGDQIVSQEPGVKTRSQTKHARDLWTTIPLLVKIFKLLINELSNAIEANMASNAIENGHSDSDDLEDEENGETPLGNTLDEMLDFPGYDDCESGDDDPDAEKDPIYHLNMQLYLTDFIQSFSQQMYFPQFVQHLNQQEKQVLSTISINV